MPLDSHRSANRDNWNERVAIHLASDAYAVERFIDDPKDISEPVTFDHTAVGDVQGKSLLHLQCHFGRDTLSWARLGANVTGIDFSGKAIQAARKLSEDSKTPGRFIESELYDSPEALKETFDIVYTSVGALCWLPDIRGWAQVVASFLKPGGLFYVRDTHPMFLALDLDRPDETLVVQHPYFGAPDPEVYEAEFSYAGDGKLTHTTNYEWAHGLGEIVTALIGAGLRIECFNEHRFLDWHGMACMERGDDGLYRMPLHLERNLPLQFSIRATC